MVCSACKNEISLVDKPDDGGAAAPAVGNGAKGAFMKDPCADGGFAELARKARPPKISITCSACGKTVHLSARAAGKTARCKACGGSIDVPYPDDLAAIHIPAVRLRPDETVRGEELLPGPEKLAEQEAPAAAPEPIAMAVIESQPAATIELDVGHREDIVGAVDEYAPDLDVGVSSRQGELMWALTDREQQSDARSRVVAAGKAKGIRPLHLAAAALAVLVPAIAAFTIVEFIGPNHADNAPGGEANTTGNVVVSPPANPPPTTNLVATRPAAAVASCTVLECLTSAFAAGGYFPARSDCLYARIRVLLQAGEKPLHLQPGVNTDFVLAVNGRDTPCLGVPVSADEGLPRRSGVGDIRLPAEASGEIVLLFELPRDAAKGTLKVRDVGQATVPFDGAAASVAVSRLVGTYLECPPRNLRPLLRHPVMAAIQAAPAQRLLVKSQGDGLRVEIPEAAVTGPARQTGPGLFHATLNGGGSELSCTLRFLGDGSAALLYLDEAPFHQITYSRTGRLPASPTPRAITPPPGSRPAGTDANARPGPREPRDLPRSKGWFD